MFTSDVRTGLFITLNKGDPLRVKKTLFEIVVFDLLMNLSIKKHLMLSYFFSVNYLFMIFIYFSIRLLFFSLFL